MFNCWNIYVSKQFEAGGRTISRNIQKSDYILEMLTYSQFKSQEST